jgi:hypothetical protein
MKELSERWGCYFLYASGSLIQCFEKSYESDAPEHRITLMPADQAKTLAKVRERLKSNDKGWTLVATSCVECGVEAAS